MKFASSALDAFHSGELRAASRSSSESNQSSATPSKSAARASPGDRDAMALHQAPKAGDTRADRTVNLFPVVKELWVGQARLLHDAVDEFDHGCLLRVPSAVFAKIVKKAQAAQRFCSARGTINHKGHEGTPRESPVFPSCPLCPLCPLWVNSLCPIRLRHQTVADAPRSLRSLCALCGESLCFAARYWVLGTGCFLCPAG